VRQEREPLDPRVSFDAVVDAFDEAHVASLRFNSRVTYRSSLLRLRKAFGSKRINQITKLDVRAFVNAETAEGLKANSVMCHLAVLSAVYGFARDDLDMPVTMPKLKASERPNPADDAREHRVLTDAELACLLQACPAMGQLYFRTLAETGARASEVLGLTARRIDSDEITFAEQLSREGQLAPLKTRKSRRTIAISRSGVDACRRL
jgi:integrase